MKNTKSILTGGLLAFALAGCGASPNAAVPNVASLSSDTLQFAVGSANLYGLQTALNVVATYRQPNGNSATLVNSPTITLPGAIGASAAASAATAYDACSTAPTGPGSTETTSITSTSQNANSTAVTSFGQSGGVYGIGIEPFNALGQADCTAASASATGTPFQVAPYPVPLYDTDSPTYAAGGDPNAFIPWGGPPAFLLTSSSISVVGSSNYPTGTAGVSEGIDVFAGVTPVASGVYTLGVSVPANTGTQAVSKSFTLPGVVVLPTPVAPAFVPDGAGGGTFALVLPAGVTEAYLQVTDYGPSDAGMVSCNGSGSGAEGVGNGTATSNVGSPVYYTIEATASGTLTLPDLLGPNTAATGTPSVCSAAQNTTANSGTPTTADQISVQVIGFDYDVYHASYPSSLGNATPAILGARGSDDLTISAAICQQGAGACVDTLPALRSARFRSAQGLKRRT